MARHGVAGKILSRADDVLGPPAAKHMMVESLKAFLVMIAKPIAPDRRKVPQSHFSGASEAQQVPVKTEAAGPGAERAIKIKHRRDGLGTEWRGRPKGVHGAQLPGRERRMHSKYIVRISDRDDQLSAGMKTQKVSGYVLL